MKADEKKEKKEKWKYSEEEYVTLSLSDNEIVKRDKLREERRKSKQERYYRHEVEIIAEQSQVVILRQIDVGFTGLYIIYVVQYVL